MNKRKERAAGTVVAAVCGFLTGGFALSVGLLQHLVTLGFVPGSILAVAGYVAAGSVVVTVSMGVFTMRPIARKLALPVHVGSSAAFGAMLLSTISNTSTALIAAVMLGLSVVAAVALVAADDVVVDGATDTSDDHATDIGTGYH